MVETTNQFVCRIALKNHLAREPWFGGESLVGHCRSSIPLNESNLNTEREIPEPYSISCEASKSLWFPHMFLGLLFTWNFSIWDGKKYANPELLSQEAIYFHPYVRENQPLACPLIVPSCALGGFSMIGVLNCDVEWSSHTRPFYEGCWKPFLHILPNITARSESRFVTLS